MGTLIITVLLGLVLAYFATQNTQSVSVNFAGNILTVPLYILAIVSVLIGLLISGIISMIDSLSSSLALHSKDTKIRQKEQTLEQLSAKIHNLEVENARLRGGRDLAENHHTSHRVEEEKPRSFFRRFRMNPSA